MERIARGHERRGWKRGWKRGWTAGAAVLLGVAFSGCDVDVDGWPDDGEQPLRMAEQAFPESDASPGQGWFFVGEALEPIDYEFRQDHAVHQGDIMLGPIDTLSPAQLGLSDVQTSAVKPDSLWPKGVIPYAFGNISDETRQGFLAAAAHWEKNTAVRFVPRDGSHADYIRVIEGSGCWSYVGRIGGAQDLSLGSGCASMGIAAHEIGHAAGLWHEQSRSDRDGSVLIHWANIIDGYASAFQTYAQTGFAGQDIGGYDVGSIMHYGTWYFSASPGVLPTITHLDGSEIVPNREALSAGDVTGVASLYGAPVDTGACGILGPNQTLLAGESISACGGAYTLVMQQDGNLVLYGPQGAVWHTHTYGTSANRAVMQGDGNLVVYDDHNVARWHAGTWGHPDAWLAVQDDSNLVIYSPGAQPLWAR